jgi:DNA-binding transcriptional regulator YiaG
METPTTLPGSRLRAQRKAYGVTAVALARELQHNRDTIAEWECHPALDVRRQRLYLAALRKLADKL